MTDTRRSREHAEKAESFVTWAARPDWHNCVLHALLALYWQREEEREDRERDRPE